MNILIYLVTTYMTPRSYKKKSANLGFSARKDDISPIELVVELHKFSVALEADGFVGEVATWQEHTFLMGSQTKGNEYIFDLHFTLAIASFIWLLFSQWCVYSSFFSKNCLQKYVWTVHECNNILPRQLRTNIASPTAQVELIRELLCAEQRGTDPVTGC